MGIITTEQRQEQKAVISSMIARFPTLSVLSLQKKLTDAGQPISYHYLLSLVNEIRVERTRAVTEQSKEDLFAEVQAVVNMVNEQLQLIAEEEKLVYSKKDEKGNPGEKVEVRIYAQQNRIKALNSVVDNLIKLLNLKMDLGIIDRKLGTADLRVIDMMAALKKIRNGNYTEPIESLIPSIASPVDDTRGSEEGGEVSA